MNNDYKNNNDDDNSKYMVRTIVACIALACGMFIVHCIMFLMGGIFPSYETLLGSFSVYETMAYVLLLSICLATGVLMIYYKLKK